MKRLLLILSLLFISSAWLYAQDEDDDNGNEKIRDKMNEYIQKRLGLNDDEARKFSPIFLRYFRDWKQTVRQNKDDKLERQKKIIDLRLNYRAQFKDIIGEQRANQVFNHQDVFIKEIRDLRQNRMRDGPARRGRVNALIGNRQ